MDWLTETPIAHQGLHSGDPPENTIGAFEAAIDAGYPIEFDVRLTADDVPVVFHDENLRRLTGRDLPVDSVSWADLSDLTILDTNEGIPRLSELLATVDGRVPLMVELKSRAVPGDLEAAVAMELDTYEGDFVVTSFNPLTLGWFRRHRPAWTRGQLGGSLATERSANPIEKSIAKHLRGSWHSKPDFVGYKKDGLQSAVVEKHSATGRPILAWTITSPEEREAVRRHSDNVIFEGFRP